MLKELISSSILITCLEDKLKNKCTKIIKILRKTKKLSITNNLDNIKLNYIIYNKLVMNIIINLLLKNKIFSPTS